MGYYFTSHPAPPQPITSLAKVIPASPPPPPNVPFANFFGSYTVANLPTNVPQWSTAVATNGLQVGDGAGAGTGCPVYFNGVWRTFSGQPVRQ